MRTFSPYQMLLAFLGVRPKNLPHDCNHVSRVCSCSRGYALSIERTSIAVLTLASVLLEENSDRLDMQPPTPAFMTNADGPRSCKTERLGEVLRRVVWRLSTQRNSIEEKERPTSTHTEAAAERPRTPAERENSGPPLYGEGTERRPYAKAGYAGGSLRNHDFSSAVAH